jgi:hypothetical protein
MDLDKAIGQRSSNKLSLGYKKSSKISNCPKSKAKQGQELNIKIVKPNNAKSFNKKHNYAFQYKQFDKKINKGQRKFQSNNATFFNPSWSNKLYLKDPMDGFMSLKINMIFKPNLKDMSINELFLKIIKIFLKKNPKLKLKD